MDYKRVLEESQDRLELYEALSAVGLDDLREFEPLVRGFLDHADAELVEQAIMTLGTRWRLPAFEAEVETMWREGESGPKRDAAFGTWTSYALLSKDKVKAETILGVLQSDAASPRMRGHALVALRRVFAVKPLFTRLSGQIAEAGSAAEIDRLIPWDEVEQICSEFDIAYSR